MTPEVYSEVVTEFEALILTIPSRLGILYYPTKKDHTLDESGIPRLSRLNGLVSAGQGAIPVWSGASDKCPWSAQANHALRAWHDATHLMLQQGFSFQEEVRVFNAQEQYLQSLCRDLTLPSLLVNGIVNLFNADGYQMLIHQREHGFFPPDQDSFIRQVLHVS